MDLKLRGRTALVTGGSRGIGLAITRQLLKEGVKVVTGSRTVTTELQASGAIPVVADLSSDEGAKTLVDGALAALGHIDLLINNVGNGDTDDVVRSTFTDLVDYPDDAWQHAFDLYFFSALRVTRRALPSLVEHAGVVVNLSSIAARVPGIGAYEYNCAKAALNALTKIVADRYGAQGVRALSVSPGPVTTMVWGDPDGFAGRIAASQGLTLEEYHAKSIDDLGIATRRLSTPEEVARLVVFLASSDNISGSDHVIDGGLLRSI